MIKACKKQLHSYPKDLRTCPGCSRVRTKAWKLANKDQVKAISKANYQATKEQKKANNRNWCLANPARRLARTRKYQAAKLHRTPPWLTKEHYHSIMLFYQAARWVESILQEPIHVDHIIPLQGENVSGLHVPWNLQLLPAPLNQSKGNRD